MPTPHFNELGRTGLKHFGGYLYEEWLAQLQGEKGWRVYKEMRDNSPIVGGMLFAVESLLRSVEWSVEPISESTEDMEAAQFLDESMHDMSHTWEDFIAEVLSMLPFGWSYFEIVYKQRDKGKVPSESSRYPDGRIGWRKFAIRGQESLYRWEFQADGGIKGMWQFPWPTTLDDQRSLDIVFLPIDRCLLFRTTSYRNSPEGRSVLRSAYQPWYFAKRLQEIEAVGAERDLAGMPIAKIPIELLSTDRNAEQTATYNYIKDIVTRVKNDQQAGIIWPLVYDENKNELFKFELISSPSSRRYQTSEIIQRYSQQIAMTILADFILLGHEQVGSFALSSDKTELFAVALGAWLDSIEEVLNRHAVPRLFELNGFELEAFPYIRHGDIEKPDLAALGTFLQHLASAGAPLFPDLVLENRLREMADLPPADPEEREKIMAAQEQAMMPMLGQGGESKPTQPEGQGAPKAQEPNQPQPQPTNPAPSTQPPSVRPPSRPSPYRIEKQLRRHRYGIKLPLS